MALTTNSMKPFAYKCRKHSHLGNRQDAHGHMFDNGSRSSASSPVQKRFPIENPGKFRIWGLGGPRGGLGGAICIEVLKKRVGRNLRIIIMLHFGLVTLGFILEKPENPSLSWSSEFRTCPRLPIPIMFDFASTK